MSEIFQKAREAISPGIVKTLFPDEKGRVVKDEYWIRNPTRIDNNVGSFSINLNTGFYKDLATLYLDQGDLIKLVSKTEGISLKEAANKIIALSVKNIPQEKIEKKVKNNIKFKPVFPIPDIKEKFKKLKWYQSQPWSIEKNGPAVSSWGWNNENGDCLWVITRHKTPGKEGGKDDIPYFFAEDDKWHQGLPFNKDRPLYGWHNYKGQKQLLIVEGQTCAQPFHDDWLCLTWANGVNSIHLSDWSLNGHEFDKVVIWPDNDSPGLLAANKIAEILKDRKPIVLDIPPSKKSKWDKKDAEDEGLNIGEFIESCEKKDVIIEREFFDPDENTPFKTLGFTERSHWFIPNDAPIPFGINRGTTSLGSLMELTSESWWYSSFPKKDNVDTTKAYDWLIEKSKKQGYFTFDKLRGAGVWREDEKIVINTGREIITQEGEKHSYKKFDSKNFYIMSQKSFGKLTGEKATTQEGRVLIDLFRAQEFNSSLDALACLGWALIAPFSTYLKWRPHVWLTGPKEIGKSYLLEEMITPLCGPIAHIGSGKDTEAAIKRAGIDGGCFIMDEMEPRTKSDRDNLDKVLGIIRNASSDSSSKISNAGQGRELIEYSMRQSFLLSSIVTHFGEGNAIKSRFFVCNLNGNINFDQKKKQTIEIVKTGLLKDPGKFRRRIFSMLPTIEANMNRIKDVIVECRGSQRDADNLAPLLSAVFSVANDGLVTDKYMENLRTWLDSYKKEVEHDEDNLVTEIFDSMIKVDTETKSIGAMVYDVINNDEADVSKYIEFLSMYGIKVDKFEGKRVIAFAPNNKNLKIVLKDTFFTSSYSDVLKRHKHAKSKTKICRVGKSSKRCILLDVEGILAGYYGYDKKVS